MLQRHPDGVASVAFKEPEEADACIQSFNGRWFGGRQLSVELWDGKTDYQVNQYTYSDGVIQTLCSSTQSKATTRICLGSFRRVGSRAGGRDDA